MAKRDKKQRPAKMTRKYRSRVERERRQVRYIFIGTSVVVAIIIIVLLAGLYQTQVANPAATRRAKDALKTVPVVKVDGTTISIADWQARVRYARQLQILQIYRIDQQLQLIDPTDEFGQQLISQGRAQIEEISNMLDLGDSIANDVLQQMVEEQLIRKEAARRGIIITPEELQKHIEVSLFEYPYPPTPEPVPTLPPPTLPPTATVTPEPTATATTVPTPRSREDFEADYQLYIEQIKEVTEMSEDVWRSMIEGQIYRQKLLEAFRADVETSVQQIKGQYILAQEQEVARTLLDRLEAGETFEMLAEEIRSDESEEPTARVGTFDWSPIGIIRQRFGDEFANVAFNTPAGQYARLPIPSLNGQIYLVYVEENEVHELTDYLIEQQQRDLFETWLDQEKLDEGIEYGNWRDFVPLEPSLQ